MIAPGNPLNQAEAGTPLKTSYGDELRAFPLRATPLWLPFQPMLYSGRFGTTGAPITPIYTLPPIRTGKGGPVADIDGTPI